MGESVRLCLAGAALDSGNRGVEALARSVLAGVALHHPGAFVSVLDNGWGSRPKTVPHVDGINIEGLGVRLSRRWHRPESWARVHLSQSVGSHRNLVAARIRGAHALLDISGGDSFTDLYGPFRFRQVLAPKLAAVRAGTPLMLLPQTYGPFRVTPARKSAEQVVRAATLSFARDEASFELLKELAGPDHEVRCRLGVDVAFGLPVVDPGDRLPASFRASLLGSDPVVGVNVSGLLWSDGASAWYGLKLDYRELVVDVVSRLRRDGARIVLVPHVVTAAGGGESDDSAVAALQEALMRSPGPPVLTAPGGLDATELKWIIARCSWFWGARMHSTIAALSSGVPGAALGYSPKTAGVFATCGVADEVVDARSTGTEDAADALVASYHDRHRVRKTLSMCLPAVLATAKAQMAEAAVAVSGLAADTELPRS